MKSSGMNSPTHPKKDIKDLQRKKRPTVITGLHHFPNIILHHGQMLHIDTIQSLLL